MRDLLHVYIPKTCAVYHAYTYAEISVPVLALSVHTLTACAQGTTLAYMLWRTGSAICFSTLHNATLANENIFHADVGANKTVSVRKP